MRTLSNNQKRALVVGILLVAPCPFPTSTVPEWRVRFVDTKGTPFANLPIEQTWQNYSIESTANYENRQTDAQGYVAFPRRVAWSPILERVLHPIANMLSTGVHASFGSSLWLISKCDVLDTGNIAAVYNGKDLPSKVVLKYFDRRDIVVTMPGTMPAPRECAAIEEQAKRADA